MAENEKTWRFLAGFLCGSVLATITVLIALLPQVQP